MATQRESCIKNGDLIQVGERKYRGRVPAYSKPYVDINSLHHPAKQLTKGIPFVRVYE